jgi:hypothetical protein
VVAIPGHLLTPLVGDVPAPADEEEGRRQRIARKEWGVSCFGTRGEGEGVPLLGALFVISV